MKKIIVSLVILGILISCKEKCEEKKIKMPVVKEQTNTKLPPIDEAITENAVIYEANIRQYSEEGRFNAFTKDIPELKKLGIKILWLMPVYPISTTKSKGTLGSYYAISEYTKVNPEFGTLEDFRTLIKTAHDNGIYVILDWVANHTGWDHLWLKEHPDFYTKNKDGAITHTADTDWTDVADLNYDNTKMRKQMQEAMKYWVAKENIDGFRCDVAGMVPADFWQQTIRQLKKIKPLFMLAEAWEPELLEKDFDMVYSWDTHHRMNDIAKGKKTVKAWDQRMAQIDTLYQKDDILMNFTTNHDENSWNGTIKERMGDAAETFTVLSYLAPGMPLIYSGQEYDLDKRLLFFEKDTIIKKKNIYFPLYEKLGTLKNHHPALNGGKNAAAYTRIQTSDDSKILAFERKKNGKKAIFVANLTKKPIKFTAGFEGKYKDYFSDQFLETTKGQEYEFVAWEYKVLITE